MCGIQSSSCGKKTPWFLVSVQSMPIYCCNYRAHVISNSGGGKSCRRGDASIDDASKSLVSLSYFLMRHDHAMQYESYKFV